MKVKIKDIDSDYREVGYFYTVNVDIDDGRTNTMGTNAYIYICPKWVSIKRHIVYDRQKIVPAVLFPGLDELTKAQIKMILEML